MKTGKTISFTLAKGGTTKTTSTINLGAALAAQRHSVCLIDIDPQGNLSTALGYDPRNLKHTLYLLPSNQKLGLVEKRLVMESGNSVFGDTAIPAELVLRRVLEPLKQFYDYILIDCPPSVGLLTINALTASDSIILPMESHFLGFEAIKQTLDVVSRVKASFNPNLYIEGILLTKFQDRTTLCRSIRDSVYKTYGETFRVFEQPIAYSIKAAEQSVCGASIFETDPHGKIAAGYLSAAMEVISRE
ncbi:chromosome partitioning protein ParA [Clostridia bacterium]|nr:chromosome partitioning protein ParA [Clostridia bacterium]